MNESMKMDIIAKYGWLFRVKGLDKHQAFNAIAKEYGYWNAVAAVK